MRCKLGTWIQLAYMGIWEKLKTILSLDDRFDYLIKGRPTNHIEAEREITGKDKNWGERGAVPLTGYKRV